MSRLTIRRCALMLALIGSVSNAAAQTRRYQRIDPERPRGISPGALKKITEAGRRFHDLGDLLRGALVVPLDAIQPPLVFEKNVGQADPGFEFVMRSPGLAAGFSRTGITAAVMRQPLGAESANYRAKGYAIQLMFGNGTSTPISGLQAVTGKVNIAKGADRSRWHRSVPSYNAISWREVYPGVEVVAKATHGRLQYGLVLGPTASLAQIHVGVRGVSGLQVDAAGRLRMRTSMGTIVQTRPRFLEISLTGKRVLKGRFKVLGATRYGFEVDGRSSGSRLLIDPEIVFASFFGGSGNEGTLEADSGATDIHRAGFDLAVGPNSNLFVVGSTSSPDFPVTTTGALLGTSDAFVMRLDPALAPGQQLVYATFVGGSSFERGVSVAAREDGSVYVVGCTTSSDFPPPSPGVVQPPPTSSVGFVLRLTPDGLPDIGTRIGRTMSHHTASVAFSKRADEPNGFVYVAGSVVPPPAGGAGDAVSGGFQTSHGGGAFDGFVVKLDPELTAFQYFTYIGGSGDDRIMDLAVNDGFAFVTGSTSSFNFPTTELATQAAHSQAASGVDCANPATARQCFDAFVTRFHRAGAALVYSTFLGGDREDFGRGVAAASNNQATVTGAAKATTGTATDIFVTRLEGGGENVIWDKRLAAAGRDHGEAVLVDALGRAHVVGTASVDGLSTSSSFHGGASDIFYARHAAATGEIEFSMFLGGAGTDRGFAVAAQGTSAENFCAMVAGSTTSQDVETVNPLQGGEENRGGADVLLFILCDIPPSIDPNSGFTKTGAPERVEAGRTLTYTITVRNGGDAPAPVRITDVVPPQLSVTQVDGCPHNGNTIDCSLSIPPGATSILIHAEAGSDCDITVTNTATIHVGSREFSSSATTRITCPPPLCGNGALNPGEECDGGDSCRSDCTRRRCGDGIRDPAEECDDGDTSNTDHCTNQCKRQCVSGDECSEDCPCVGNLVCGKRCSWVDCDRGLDLGDLCILGDSYWLCELRYECMPANEATYTRGD